MGTTLASCSHFVFSKLLHYWRQATVVMFGCNFIFVLLTQSDDSLYSPWLLNRTFYSATLQLSLRLSFRLAFLDRVLSHLPLGLNLAIHPSKTWNYPVLQLSCSLASIRNLRFFSLLDLNSTF